MAVDAHDLNVPEIGLVREVSHAIEAGANSPIKEKLAS